MPSNKSRSDPFIARGEPLRRRVLDAAERLLRDSKAEFSMRDLASEAGVSFATPFNQFGSKAAIMQALSARRIDTMEMRFATAPPCADVTDRILLAMEVAAAVMLEDPAVNRAVMGSLGSTNPSPGGILARSTAFWALALGTGDGLIATRREQALLCLPMQLAFGFRGVLSFWTAGELPDDALASHAQGVASTLLIAFTKRRSKEYPGG
jgi:AcrR family transcriptional regulator